MKKIISYSLWGDNPKYTVGAIKNALLANKLYPSWISRYYYGSTVPENIITQLSEIPNTETVLMTTENNWKSMFWRFQSCYDNSVEISIFRDTDSRLSSREKLAVDDWLKTGKTFHIMRDHPFHKYPILGGMWGYRHNHRYDMKTLLSSYTPSNQYGTDYEFLGNILYPLIMEDKVVHDDFFEHKPFPTSRIANEFVGDVFDENDNRHSEYYKHII